MKHSDNILLNPIIGLVLLVGTIGFDVILVASGKMFSLDTGNALGLILITFFNGIAASVAIISLTDRVFTQILSIYQTLKLGIYYTVCQYTVLNATDEYFSIYPANSSLPYVLTILILNIIFMTIVAIVGVSTSLHVDDEYYNKNENKDEEKKENGAHMFYVFIILFFFLIIFLMFMTRNSDLKNTRTIEEYNFIVYCILGSSLSLGIPYILSLLVFSLGNKE